MKNKRVTAEILGEKQGFPLVACTAEWVKKGRDSYWSLKFNCPWCNKTHCHNGGTKENPSAGHRVTHCFDSDVAGYILTVTDYLGDWEHVRPKTRASPW